MSTRSSRKRTVQPAGQRDYALLTLALQTGRRLSEMASLQWGDIHLSSGRATVTWRRCKGGKVMHDALPGAACRMP